MEPHNIVMNLIVFAIIIWLFYRKHIYEKLKLEEKFSTEATKNRCFKCDSDAIITGQIDDGHNRIFYSNYFDPGCVKWYHFFSWPGVRVCSLFCCCSNCGLIWTVLNPDTLKEYIVKKGGNAFWDKHDANQDNKKCPDCESANIIEGKLFGCSESSRGRTSDYSLCFNPGNIKFKLLWKCGVNVDKKSYCCADCGFVFSAVDRDKLRKFITDNCKK